ncbi:hypothetical protein SRABI27_02897 [Pedobacter sp. Bi27]|nr:hypothetical protein SRABI36_00361 [Pedobacter sp. Bi36]CAH0189114.1 hypothetical protein SRABI126_01455 [Pedobacter sp. Bi126]CAH0248341.1 hypothetical protein SRABI27_02897 [Pedobacter sp. Bi27]
MGDYAKCLFVDPNLSGFRNLVGLFSLPPKNRCFRLNKPDRTKSPERSMSEDLEG